MVAHQKQVADIIKVDPNVQQFTSNIGTGGGGSSSNQGRFSIDLKPVRPMFEKPDPARCRELTADEVINEMRRKVGGVPGVRVFLQNPPAIRIGGQRTNSAYQYTLQSVDTGELYEWAPKLEQALHEMPGLVDVSSDLQLANPQVNVVARSRSHRGAGPDGRPGRERDGERLQHGAGRPPSTRRTISIRC